MKVSPFDIKFEDQAESKGWYRRGEHHPPHFDGAGCSQFVTFRLYGSIPEQAMQRLHDSYNDGTISGEEYFDKLEMWLNKGSGNRWLERPAVARIVESALLSFDRSRYDLHARVIMPNHVHVLVTILAGNKLSEVLKSWKSYSASRANALLGRSGKFWQDDYFDRFIRNGDHFDRTVGYIAWNPPVAGLCERPEDWRFSHAWCGSDKVVGDGLR